MAGSFAILAVMVVLELILNKKGLDYFSIVITSFVNDGLPFERWTPIFTVKNVRQKQNTLAYSCRRIAESTPYEKSVQWLCLLFSGRRLDLEQARAADGQGREGRCSRVQGCQDGRRKEEEVTCGQ